MRIRSAPGRDGLGQLRLGLDLDFDGRSGGAGAGRFDRARHAARKPPVVVLDQHHLGQIVPVVHAAAVAHGLAVEGAQARRGLARVENPAAGALDRVDEAARRGRDAAHALQEVQRHALGRQDRARAAREVRERRRRGDLRARGRGLVPRELRVEQREHAPRHGQPRNDALGLRHELAPRARAGRHGRLGGDVDPPDVLGEKRAQTLVEPCALELLHALTTARACAAAASPPPGASLRAARSPAVRRAGRGRASRAC